MGKEVLLVLTDRWCDWEASYAIAIINTYSKDGTKVNTIAGDKESKVSMGGIRAEVDYTFSEYNSFDNIALIILTGGLSWSEHSHDDIVMLVKKAVSRRIPVAAICCATTFLAKNGFLNSIWHTGESREALQSVPGYEGHKMFVHAPVVVDRGFITANETAAVEFAYEILRILGYNNLTERHEWYERFNTKTELRR